MLPPKPSPRRELAVNIRFSAPEYERLKRIADYRDLSVTTLLHHVISQYVLPRLEREVEKEQQSGATTPNVDAEATWLTAHEG